MLEALEQEPVPTDQKMASLQAAYIRDLRRKLGLGQARTIVREQTRGRVERLRALGNWGEKKAIDLLKRAGFSAVTELNADFSNHPFGDICAERNGARYLIGVKTRNKYQASGLINPTYNVRKRGVDVGAIAEQRKAIPAWIAIPVIPEEQTFSAYFGTILQINEAGERFSIPMGPEQTARYERLSRPIQEFDRSIRPEWSNGGYAAYQQRHLP
jgi:hypothetical protein